MQPKGDKKRKYNSLVLRRRDSNLGEIQEENVQINPLPPVGSCVVILEKYRFGESNYLNGDGIREYYIAASSYTDSFGNSYIYKVKGYTKGIGNPLDNRNMVELIHYYGGKEENGSHITRLKAKEIAIGCYRLDIVKDMAESTFDVSRIDKKDRIAQMGVVYGK